MRKFQPVFLLLSLLLVSPGQTSEIVLPVSKLVDAGLAVELVADGFERPVFLSAPPGDRSAIPGIMTSITKSTCVISEPTVSRA